MDTAELEKMLEQSMAVLPAAGIAAAGAVGPLTATRCRGAVGGAAMTGRSVLYAASVTKQLIGLLAAAAVQERRLGYRDRVADLIPGLSGHVPDVEVRHLLHHTSGLAEVTGSPQSPSVSNADVLAAVCAAPNAPRTRPGARFAYSNTGYVLLALLLEAVEGEPVERLAARRLFQPLGMADSHLGSPPRPLPGFPDPPGTVGDGGLWTTAEDLLRWLSALNDLRPSAAAVRRAEQPGRLDDGTALDYGWGVRITPVPSGRMMTHGGSWPGWLAKTVRIPEQQIAVAVLSHHSDEEAISALGTTLAARIASATPA